MKIKTKDILIATGIAAGSYLLLSMLNRGGSPPPTNPNTGGGGSGPTGGGGSVPTGGVTQFHRDWTDAFKGDFDAWVASPNIYTTAMQLPDADLRLIAQDWQARYAASSGGEDLAQAMYNAYYYNPLGWRQGPQDVYDRLLTL